MANYSLVANTVFKNRSFEDLLKPLAMYTEEYNTLENTINELETKANVWEGMADEERDPVAYAQFKRYSDDLRDQATVLAQNGLNPSTRRNLLNLKKRYSSEITPIEQAYASRKAQADEQRKALLQNPTLLLSRRADMTSLDRYLDNPQLGYDSYSGALLTQQVGTAAAQIAKELRDYGNGKKLDGFTRTWLQQHGFTAAEVAQAINNPDSPKSSQILNTLVGNVIADSGIPQWADRATLGQAYNYARQGLWQAIGQTQIQTYTDEAARIAAQEASQKRLTDYALQQQAAMMNNNRTTSAVINPSNINSGEEAAAQMRNLKSYKDFFTTTSDGKTILSKKGLEEYNRNATPRVSEAASGGATARLMNAETRLGNENRPFTPTEFRKFIDELGGAEMMAKKQYGNIGNLWNQYKAKDFLRYDATALTEYNHNIDPSDYTNWKDRIRERSNGKLEKVKWDKKTKSWVADGMEDISAVFANDGNPTSTQSSIYGRTFRVVDKNGKTTRYRLPRGINTRAEQNIDSHLQALNVVQSLYKELDSSGNKRLTVAEANQLNKITGSKVFYGGSVINYPTLQAVNAALEDALATFESQLGLTNTNKPQEWGAISFGNNLGTFVSDTESSEEE